jgi:hypothetical protein
VRRQLRKNGKALLSHGRALSDEELLAKLRTLGLALDRDRFRALSQGALSAQEMAQAVYRQRDEDWVWIAYTCLWERWQPDRPSMEMIDDWMQQGYKLRAARDEAGACRIWLTTWKSIWDIIKAKGLRSVEEFDALFRGTNSLFDWVQDLAQELHNAGLDDVSFYHERIAVLEALLGLRLDVGLRNPCRNDLAESYFAVGQPEKGEQLYREWLQQEPRWGWGWIGWSDCHFLCARDWHKDPARAEEILKQGLAVHGVEDKQWLMDRLAELYEETGRAEDARGIRADIQALERLEAAVPKATRTLLRGNEPAGFGQPGLPAGDLDRLLGRLGKESPVPARGKVGRNSPCPCGSGKKFKHCCGRNSS